MWDAEATPFRFNFGGAASEPEEPQPPPLSGDDAAFVELSADELELDECAQCGVEEQKLPQSSIRRVRPCPTHGTASGVACSNSDLVPRVYEGGFKLWECALDLAAYVEETAASWRGLRVAELGCGHGIPGLVALRHGAACVHLQDYNAEVLARVTARNCALACGGREAARAALRSGALRFVAGGWASALARLGPAGEGQQYDVILTSETIYSKEAMAPLLDLIAGTLRPASGFAYPALRPPRPAPRAARPRAPPLTRGTLVAAKRHYFGVGGGVLAFEALVARDGRLACSRLRAYEDGSSNTRDLLRLAWPP